MALRCLRTVSTMWGFALLLYLSTPAKSAPTTKDLAAFSSEAKCRNEAFGLTDFSAKSRTEFFLPVCAAEEHSQHLSRRQKVQEDDYSCSASKPCRNGACCSKATGFCNYGPEACGTNGQSPNDKCWSNCDATAECGRYAKVPGQKCPLNVCCSQFGFCGMTKDFCAKTDNLNTTCQSNCDQPGSGASGGDVQKRVLGYYEAWVAKRACNGMSINQIPVDALTHLLFSFGYVTPGSFEVVPMDGIDASTLRDFTAIKSKNPGLKTMIAIGGWTFSDNGTATQPLLGQISASAANRATFISNLLSFMRQYAFDGVDFDWEYPGAPDRGGLPDDGKNFVTLLKELRERTDKEPVPYTISFTIPTSYWYLRHFDLSAVDHVDFVNVMSYDLHGVWDAENPIGRTVLGHTNITEIDLAMDLLWRNNMPAAKLNLGLGFYGRSFQLADPSCSTPGCSFKGGAAPGPCTDNSGTLAYFEIKDLIDKHNLKPYYDKEAQVKYIVWNQDQWISYDDADTFKAKVEYANKKGLGGLLIWSIDQDTQNLDALSAVVGRNRIDAFRKRAEKADYWQEAVAQDCYTTDCGGSCKTGFLTITKQPCGDATPVFRHSSADDSSLCCPIAAAPNAKDCTWRGTAPSCNGQCLDGEVALQSNRWGDGKYCEDGNKFYCCKANAIENTCYWTGEGGNCRSGDQPLTFAGTFLDTLADITSLDGLFGNPLSDALNAISMDLRRLYCCPPDMLKEWKNCKWHGEPGSCFDDHCDTGHQVQLAASTYGGGLTCLPRAERQRVFCCDPAKGKSPFLPVPLEYLFPSPPTGPDVSTDFDLNIDDTWGTGSDKNAEDDDPNKATFGFWVMSSPEEIQVSLDKRDGSHWELFNCDDAESEESQTVQMVCTDHSEDSNCHKIGLGKGVPGTIIQMPSGQGCGPAKYAVAESMVPAKNQTLPHHLRKRLASSGAVVYDLTFGYDWHLIPRDAGPTQVRIDYSNEEGYWDAIVNKAGEGKLKKRSLDNMNRNHRRWLEEEWRDDVHHGALTTEGLHKRWFGSSVISWLKGFLNVNIKPTFSHDYSDSVTAIIIQDEHTCHPTPQTTLKMSLTALATAKIQLSSTFGMTILTTLPDLDLSNSYLFLKTKGEVSAIFSIDALVEVDFDSKDILIADLPFPGASFKIPKLMTVGPQLILNAQAKGKVELAGRMETQVKIANWDVQQTYPEQTSEFDPKGLSEPRRDAGIQGLRQPTFDASVQARGSLTAYLKPTLSFGITFDDYWKVGKCAAELIATGWVRIRAEAGSTDPACWFKYGVDAGAELVARATAPDAFKWNAQSFSLFGIQSNIVPGNNDDWVCVAQRVGKRDDWNETESTMLIGSDDDYSHAHLNTLAKRSITRGPFFSIPGGWGCAGKAEDGGQSCGTIRAYTKSEVTPPWEKRSVEPEDPDDLQNWLEKRGGTRDFEFCQGDARMSYTSPSYPSGSVTYDCENWDVCENFNFGIHGPASGHDYIDEHVLELQMVQQFADGYLKGQGYCKRIQSFWAPARNAPRFNGKRVWDYIVSVYPSDNGFGSEIVRLDDEVNGVKARMFKANTAIGEDSKIREWLTTVPDSNKLFKLLKDCVMVAKYMNDATVNGYYKKQADRIGKQFTEAETQLTTFYRDQSPSYQSFGLEQLWLTWMKEYTSYCSDKLQSFMDLWLGQLKARWIDPNGGAPKAGTENLVAKIKALEKEIDALRQAGTFNNPF